MHTKKQKPEQWKLIPKLGYVFVLGVSNTSSVLIGYNIKNYLSCELYYVCDAHYLAHLNQHHLWRRQLSFVNGAAS